MQAITVDANKMSQSENEAKFQLRGVQVREKERQVNPEA